MTHLTTKAISALNRGVVPVSVLEIDLPDGSVLRRSDRGANSATKLIRSGVLSWSPITYATSDREGRVEAVRASVELADDPRTRTLARLFRGEYARLIRGSAARIWAAIPGLEESEWWRRFTGVVTNVDQPRPFVWRIAMKLDLDALRGDGFRRQVTRDDFPTAPDESIGATIPEVYGVYDSTGTGVTGMLPTIRVSTDGDPQDATKPYRYLVSAKRIPNVAKRWTNGASETTLGNLGVDWFWTLRNGHVYSEIGFSSDPGASAEVTVDAYGIANIATPTSDPTDASEVIQNPVEALRHYLTNNVFNDWNDGTNRTDYFDPFIDAPLEQVSWNAAQAYFALKNSVAARAIPEQSVEQTMREWFNSWQVGFFLQEEGKLGLALNNPHTTKDAIYGDTILRRSDMIDMFALESESEQTIARIRHKFFLVESTGQYLGSRTVQDPARTIRREETLLMPWSGATEPSV